MGSCKLSANAKKVSETANSKQKTNQPAIKIQALGEISTLIFIIQETETLQISTKGIYITDSNNTILKGITTGLTSVNGEYQITFIKNQCSKLSKEIEIFFKEQVFGKGSTKKRAQFLKVGNYIQLIGSGKLSLFQLVDFFFLVNAALQSLLKVIYKPMKQIYFEVESQTLLDPLKKSLSLLLESKLLNKAQMLFLNSDSNPLHLDSLFAQDQLTNFSELQFISLQNQSLTVNSFLLICKGDSFTKMKCLQLNQLSNTFFQELQEYIEINQDVQLSLPVGFKISITEQWSLANFIKLINFKMFKNVKTVIIEIATDIEPSNCEENLISSEYLNPEQLQITCDFEKFSFKQFFQSPKNSIIKQLDFNEINTQVVHDLLENKVYQFPLLTKFKFCFPILENEEQELLKIIQAEKTKNLILFEVNNRMDFNSQEQLDQFFKEEDTGEQENRDNQEMKQRLLLENFRFTTSEILQIIALNYTKLQMLTFSLNISIKIINEVIMYQFQVLINQLQKSTFPNKEKIDEQIKNIRIRCPLLNQLKFNYSNKDELIKLAQSFGALLSSQDKIIDQEEKQYCYNYIIFNFFSQRIY